MTSTATAFAGARLLVVDDEVAQMKALCNTLEHEQACPGERGCCACHADTFDCGLDCAASARASVS